MNTFQRFQHLSEQTVLSTIAKFLVGAYPHWTTGTALAPGRSRIYFANHSSNLDTLALLAALPFDLRKATRPVAAKDYWTTTWLRRHAALVALNAVLIDRKRTDPGDPLAPAIQALEQGSSLIIFPEGQRNADELPGPFKSGIYHLSKHFPDVDLVPVYLENIGRSMPKGNALPLPFICRARFGEPMRAGPDESKNDFVSRARQAVIDLAEIELQ
jgi:1-acyl-sn-glycerol-3-phosphate acyltransferase